jgi:hypothetical protein
MRRPDRDAARERGRSLYAERIYVVNGKTLHVRPELRVEPKS